MDAPDPLPKYVYKIVPSAPPDPIPEAYPLSELDQKDGFVHLSTSWQIPITADLFFKDATELWMVKIRFEDKFKDKTKWNETPGTNGCPHLYGNFGREDVEAVQCFKRKGDETWAEALRGDKGAWLE